MTATDAGPAQTRRATFEKKALEELAELTQGRESLTIAEVAGKVGITAHTLRYYERIGLLDVPRDHAGRRCYRPEDVARAVFITRLRMTDMPINRIQRYFELVAAGPGTEPQRLELLQEHRDEVLSRLTNLQTALAHIEFKIEVYGGSMSIESCTPLDL